MSVTADPGQITRLSFIDSNDDIVQVEFSGAGTLSLVLDGATGPAAPVNYNQSTSYMKGHAGIVLTGANGTTNLSVFSVGRATAVNQGLFKDNVTYDGYADLAFVAITSTDGNFGGLRAADARFSAAKGLTGIYAPMVQFTGPVFIGDIDAAADATPVLILGGSNNTRVTGGDLIQTNGRLIQVTGNTQMQFTAGSNSHGTVFSAYSDYVGQVPHSIDVSGQFAEPTIPVITSQPLTYNGVVGGTADFSVGVSGPGPFNYQWRKGGNDLTGETNSTLVISNLTAANVASYDVVVTNAGGSVTSSAAILLLRGLGTAGQQFVAVGEFGTILTSPDGAIWTTRNSGSTKRLRAAAAEAHMIVAVGEAGTILSSGDGSGWTARGSGVSQTLRGIASSPTHFVAVGGDGASLIRYSADGVFWSGATVPALGKLRAIAYGGGKFVAVGYGGTILTSTDVVNWTSQAAGTTERLDGVVWTGSQFVVVSETGRVLSSSDGINWSSTASAMPSWLEGLAWSDSKYVAVGIGSRIENSTDGSFWAAAPSGTPQWLHGVTWTGVSFSPIGNPVSLLSNLNQAPSISTSPTGSVVGAGGSGSLHVVASGTGPFSYQWRKNGSALADGGHYAGTTTDTLVVTNAQAADMASYDVVVTGVTGSVISKSAAVVVRGSGAIGQQFVAVGEAGTLLTSPDGQSWTSRTTGSTKRLRAATANADSFFVVGESGTLLTSTDGVTWTNRASGTNETLRGVAVGPQIIVAVGGDTSAQLCFSVSGTTWTGGPLIGLGKLRAITYGAGMFVTVGQDGKILTSTDGTGWTFRASGTTERLDGVTWTGTTFVIVGETGRVLTSADGLTWASTTSTPPSWPEGVTWSDSRYVVVGARGRIATSIDGIAWNDVVSGTAQTLHGVTWSGATFTPAGSIATLISNLNQAPGFAVPPGGAFAGEGMNAGFTVTPSGMGPFTYQWRRNGVPLVEDAHFAGTTGPTLGITNVQAADAGGYDVLITGAFGSAISKAAPLVIKGIGSIGQQFVAVGANGIVMTSPDGLAWISRGSWTSKRLRAVTAAANLFVAVGESGTVFTSTNGTGWIPRTSGVTQTLRGVVASPTEFVAVGGDTGGLIRFSADGIVWQGVSIPPTGKLRAVTYGRGRYLAVGQGGAILTSFDGWEWQARSASTEERLDGVVWTGNEFVVLTETGRLLSSTDTTTWNSATSVPPTWVEGLTWSDALYLTVGANGRIASSPDGGMWTVISNATALTLHGVAWSGGVFAPAANPATLFSNLSQVPAVTLSTDGTLVGPGAGATFSVNATGAGPFTYQWRRNGVPLSDGGKFSGSSTPVLSIANVQAGEAGAYSVSVTGSTGTTISGTAVLALRGGGTIQPQFVAVGEKGTLMTSPDGMAWTTRTSGTSKRLRAATTGVDKIVVVGESGTILTSNDGATWTSRNANVTQTLRGVAAGPFQYVAVGGDTGSVIRWSTDGIAWSAVAPAIPATSKLRAIAYGSAQFVAVGTAGTIVTSPDGGTWNARGSGTNERLDGVFWTGTQFVVVSETGNVLSSVDGVTWTSAVGNPPAWVEGLTWNESKYVAVGAAGRMAMSPDGAFWTAVPSGAVETFHGVTWTGGALVPSGNPVTLLSNLGGTPTINLQSTPSVANVGGTAVFAVDVLGTGPFTYQWRFNGVPLANGARITGATAPNMMISGVASTDQGRYDVVVTGATGSVLGKSSNLLVVGAPALTFPTFRNSGTSLGLMGVATNGAQYVAVGFLGTVLTSSDAVTWTMQRALKLSLSAVAWGAGHFVAVGVNGLVFRSVDGVEWTATQVGTAWLRGIAWTGSQFVVVGDGGAIATSPDGVTWTAKNSGTTNSLADVMWDGGQFIAVGDAGTILTSVDGDTWATRRSGNAPWLGGVAWNGSTYVAVGGSNAILVSSDAWNWTSLFPEGSGTYLNRVTWTGSEFIAVGYGGKMLTSVLGTTWQETVLGPQNEFFGATFANGRYVAVGDYGTVLTAGGNGPAVAPAIALQPRSRRTDSLPSANFFVAATGTAPLTYRWQIDGVDLAGNPAATTPWLSFGAGQLVVGADYTAVVSNAAGSVVSDSAAIALLGNAGVLPTLTAQVDEGSYAVMAVDVAHVGGAGRFLYVAETSSPRFNDLVVRNESDRQQLYRRHSTDGLFARFLRNSHSLIFTEGNAITLLNANFDVVSTNAIGSTGSFAAHFALSPDNSRVAVMLYDGTLQILDVTQAFALVKSYALPEMGNSGGNRPVAFSPNGQRVAVGGDYANPEVAIVDLGTDAITRFTTDFVTGVHSVSWANNERLLIGAGYADGRVVQLNVTDGTKVSTAAVLNHYVYDLEYLPASGAAVFGGYDGKLMLWESGLPANGGARLIGTLPVINDIADSGDTLVVGTGGGFGGSVYLYSFAANPPAPPVITSAPRSLTVPIAQPVALSVTTAPGGTNPTVRWELNGVPVPGGTSGTYSEATVHTFQAGVYRAIATNGAGTVQSPPALLALAGVTKVDSAAVEVASNVLNPNGNIYDEMLLLGATGLIRADPGQIARISWIDLNNDIVSAEFSGAGYLTIVLDAAGSPAPAINYNQPGVLYTKGHARLVIAGADESTNLSVYSIGRANTANQAIFRNDVAYDGVADLASIAIASSNGKFGGLRAGNASFFATTGMTGIYAPGVSFTGPIQVGDISASDAAQPVLVAGFAGDVKIMGGDLLQPNGALIDIRGFNNPLFVPGLTSHGLILTAKTNQGWFQSFTLAPTITSGTHATFTLGQANSATIFAPASPLAQYSIVGALPAGLTFNGLTGILSGTPTSTVGSPFTLAVTASNGVGTDNQSFTLDVVAPPAAPAIASQPTDQVALSLATATFTINVSGVPTPTLQWQVSTDGAATWANLVSDAIYRGVNSPALAVLAGPALNGYKYRVVATNASGSVTSNAATLTVHNFSGTHDLVGGGYVAGSTMTVTNSFNYSEEISSLSWSVLLPSGFKFVSAANTGSPTVSPGADDIGTISWLWATIPPSGSTFTYTVSVPADASGDKEFAAVVEMTLASNAQGIQFTAKPDPLVVSALRFHDADTNHNDKIDVTELSRVIALYNTRFLTPDGKIRTGAYALATTSTTDGFAPDGTRDSNAAVTLARYHTADTNHNGKIDVTELSRVITLYNTRFTTPDGKIRTGFYKLAPGTLPDGFAPDPNQAP